MRDANPVFIPGPTNIPPQVLRLMSQPTVDHRSAEFAQQMPELMNKLRRVLKTEAAKVFIFPSTGTGGWEAAIANTLSRGDRVLACRHGVFSDKWIRLCQNFGLEVDVIECDWRGPADPSQIEARLAADTQSKIKAVLVTHNETATGVRSDLPAIRHSINQAGHDALLMVDGVSSIASMEFEMDSWGIDIAVTGSQKGFMLPAGLAIIAMSERAIAATYSADLPKFFFDLRQMDEAVAAGGYPYTPATQLLSALSFSCDLLLNEGIDRVAQRHFHIAEGVRLAVAAWGLEICAGDSHFASDTVTAIMVPPGFDSNKLTQRAYERYGVSFGVGLGQMAGKAFRIGHLGQLTEVQALSGLATIEMAMLDLGYSIKAGSGVAAAQNWYRTSCVGTSLSNINICEQEAVPA